VRAHTPAHMRTRARTHPHHDVYPAAATLAPSASFRHAPSPHQVRPSARDWLRSYMPWQSHAAGLPTCVP
jgi:hypothetical protein